MEKKCLRKSTMQQLQALVEHMELNPELARGTPVFGVNKLAVEEEWSNLSKKLNAMGPPTRSIAEWKKTWADLKCRTKKKISENKRSMQGTGGGLYRCNPLTTLEQVIDRTLFLSSAAAPPGKVFGGVVDSCVSQSLDDYFITLVESPPRVTKAVAVITPRRTIEENVQGVSPSPIIDRPQNLQQNLTHQKTRPKEDNSHQSDSENDKPSCSSSKKRRTHVSQQLSLIRRQLRVSEKTASIAMQQADAIKRLADAAEAQAESRKKRAGAAEAQAECIKSILESFQRFEKNMELFLLNLRK